MQTWAKFYSTVDFGTMGHTNLAILQQGQKWLTSWQTICCTFCVLCHSCSLLFVASFVVFNTLEFCLNWFFTLISFDKKENAVLMQTRVIFVLAWQRQIIHHCKAHVYKMMCSYIVCDYLFVVLIPKWPLSSDMTCFYYITRAQQ